MVSIWQHKFGEGDGRRGEGLLEIGDGLNRAIRGLISPAREVFIGHSLMWGWFLFLFYAGIMLMDGLA